MCLEKLVHDFYRALGKVLEVFANGPWRLT